MFDLNSKRRKFFQQTGLLATSAALGVSDALSTEKSLLQETPGCGSDTTARQSAGPFFSPNTPHRNDFRADDPGGLPFQLVGFVKSRDCMPLAGAMVELWHADSKGTYDNRGYRMRGHQFTDSKGRFIFHTHQPGIYPGRTRHFHVTVIIAGQDTLTTQLYFPKEPGNQRDSFFDPRLTMHVGEVADITTGRFDFVV